ncbi:MAG: ABC transporter substrate-binding protein [Trueperaceae bacterium]
MPILDTFKRVISKRPSLLLMLAMLIFAGFATAQEEIVVRTWDDFSGADPASIQAIQNEMLARNVYSGLVDYDVDTYEIIPDLALQWEVSDDGTTYTFELREDVTWHKGFGEFTAADVKYSFERIMDPETASRFAGVFSGIVSIETPNPHTVVIELEEPDATFLHKLTNLRQGSIVNQAAVEEFGDDYAFNPIGTGPFVFEAWSPGGDIVLQRHEDYFRGPAPTETIVLRVIKEQSTAEAALIRGEIDVFYYLTDPDVYERLTQAEDFQIVSDVGSYALGLFINARNEPLTDPLVRQAVAYGINRDAIAQDFFKGLMTRVDSPIPPGVPGHAEDTMSYDYDPERAQELLAEAGYPDGVGINLVTLTSFPFDQLGTIIAGDLERVGINVDLEVLDRGAFTAARSSGTPDTVIGSFAAPPDAAAQLMGLFHSSSKSPGLNVSWYDDIDDLLAEAAQESDDERRLALYGEAQQIVMDDMIFLPLYTHQSTAALQPDIRGYSENSSRHVWLYHVRRE